MPISFKRLLLLFLLATFWPAAVLAGPSVLYLSNSYPTDPFGRQLQQFMQQAADDFDLELSVIYNIEQDGASARRVFQLLKSDSPPDYLVLGYHPFTSLFMSAAEAAGTHTIMINASLGPDGSKPLGEPGGLYSHWLGAVFSDDFQTGFDALNYLYDVWPDKAKPLRVAGINGEFITLPAHERRRGLLAAVSEHDNVDVVMDIGQSWAPELTIKAMYRNGWRKKNIDAYWTASDTLALRVIEALNGQGVSADDYHIIGVDWTEQGLQSILRGELDASLGGHLFEGAWAMVMINDHLHKVDFSKRNTYIKARQLLANKDNAELLYRLVYGDLAAKIDFKRYSLEGADTTKNYDFSIESLLQTTKK